MIDSPLFAELPHESELIELPRPGLVAYAVRNALRVLPLFGQMEFYCSRDQFRAYAEALNRVTRLCRPAGTAQHEFSTEAKAARSASKAAAYVHAAAASRAAYAVNRAYVAADIRHGGSRAAAFAAAFATTAYSVASAKSESACEESTIAMSARSAARHDYDRLSDYFRFSASGDELSIDISSEGPVGPLWPDGIPDWYAGTSRKWAAALHNAGLASSDQF